jgi:hypothetical protein
MTQNVRLEWLNEPRAQRGNAQACNMPGKRIIFVDNYGGHNDSDKAKDHLDRVRTRIRKLVACATDKVSALRQLRDIQNQGLVVVHVGGVQVLSDQGTPVGDLVRGHTKSRQDVLFAPRC